MLRIIVNRLKPLEKMKDMQERFRPTAFKNTIALAKDSLEYYEHQCIREIIPKDLIEHLSVLCKALDMNELRQSIA